MIHNQTCVVVVVIKLRICWQSTPHRNCLLWQISMGGNTGAVLCLFRTLWLARLWWLTRTPNIISTLTTSCPTNKNDFKRLPADFKVNSSSRPTTQPSFVWIINPLRHSYRLLLSYLLSQWQYSACFTSWSAGPLFLWAGVEELTGLYCSQYAITKDAVTHTFMSVIEWMTMSD